MGSKRILVVTGRHGTRRAMTVADAKPERRAYEESAKMRQSRNGGALQKGERRSVTVVART